MATELPVDNPPSAQTGKRHELIHHRQNTELFQRKLSDGASDKMLGGLLERPGGAQQFGPGRFRERSSVRPRPYSLG